MTLRATCTALLAAGTALFLTVPAYADCAEHLKVLDGQVTGVEPQVQSTDSVPEKTATGADTEASTLQNLDDQTQTEAALIISEARAAAESGDEHGCMVRLQAARKLIEEH